MKSLELRMVEYKHNNLCFSFMNKNIKNTIICFSLAIIYLIQGHFTNIYIPCVFHEITGLWCSGCGGTRMIISLLHGDFKQAFYYNQLLFISFPIFLFLFIDYIISNIFSKKELYKSIPKFIYYIYIIILVLFMIIRNIYPYFSPTTI